MPSTPSLFFLPYTSCSLAVKGPPNPARDLDLWETESVVAPLAEFGEEPRPQEYFCNILIPGNASGDRCIGSFCADQNVITGTNLTVLD